ncbi:MAG: helix-turn-helix transcriptional regulator [Hyphomonas sp.]|nr:helix-turn-helix transcriptional regulator [Hyphomonas sp.]
MTTPTDPAPQKQARALKTRAKLMAALERLLRTREFEEIAVADIAREAGVAVGSVYSHFRDKPAFLAELLTYWQVRLESRLEEAEAQDTAALFRQFGSLRGALDAVTRAVSEEVAATAHMLRAVHTSARLNPAMADGRWQELTVRSFAPMQALFDVFALEITCPDPELAAGYLCYVFNTVFLRTALMPRDTLMQAAGLTQEHLIAETTEMIHAYLTRPRG